MKIVTWNLGHISPGSHKQHIGKAYDYLFNEIDADYCLFQEGSFDDLGKYESKVQFERISYRPNGITGVYSSKHKIKKIEAPPTLPGSFCAVDAGDFCLISLYAIVEMLYKGDKAEIYYAGNLHKIFSDLTFILWNYHQNFKWHLVAGDFNTDIDYYGNTQADRADLQILEDRITQSYKLTNVNKLAQLKGGTYRTRQGNEYQLDYVYLADTIIESYRKITIIDNEQIRTYSDHKPVLLELD